MSGTPRPPPPGADLAAYRIIQEALTNVLEYGSERGADLSLRHADDGLHVEVSRPTSPAPVPAGAANCAVHGLVGMRERAFMYGGSFTAGPRPDDGTFAVTAHLLAEVAE